MSPRRAKVMASRVATDPAATLRDHLVDTAAALTSRTPISQITTREIARAADVSDGVLYNYFHDKTDLLVEALVRRLRRSIESATARVPQAGSGTVEGNLLSIVAMLLEVEREVVPMIAGLLSDPDLLHRTFRELHRDPLGPQWFLAPLVGYLEGERRLGRVRADLDPDATVVLLLGSTGILALAGQVDLGAQADASDRMPGLVNDLLLGLRPA